MSNIEIETKENIEQHLSEKHKVKVYVNDVMVPLAYGEMDEIVQELRGPMDYTELEHVVIGFVNNDRHKFVYVEARYKKDVLGNRLEDMAKLGFKVNSLYAFPYRRLQINFHKNY